MKAICWHGRSDVRYESVPDPEVLNPRDVVLKITLTAICGSDLHLYDNRIPTLQSGDVLGHEFMGRVVQKGDSVHNLEVGDRVVIPFTIACGGCFFCKRGLTSCCDNSNPNHQLAETQYGFVPSGLFGYSHLFGGYAGGQAEYVRVPFADVGALKVPEKLSDEQSLFLSDIFPTGYMAAEQCDIQPGDTVAVWGCGPVGQFTLWSARKLGAGRLIAIDRYPERLEMARRVVDAETINFAEVDVYKTLKDMTSNRGPDACIDAVGMEAHGASLDHFVDKVKETVLRAPDRAHVLRQAIHCCRKGGVVSVPGVYGGFIDQVPFGVAFGKGLRFRMGQTHVHKYLPRLLDFIEKGEIDPSYVISHRAPLSDGAKLYSTFQKKEERCTKVVLTP